MQDLPLFRNGLRSFFRTGVTLTAQNPPFCNPSVARARHVRRSSFAVFESPVTRDKDEVLMPSDKIVPARCPFHVLVALMFHLVAPAARLRGLFILRAVPVTVLEQADRQQVTLPCPRGRS